MSFKLKLSIRGAEPPVSRTVTVPSGTSMYDSAQVFVTAMGWPGGRHHKFTVDDDPATREIEDKVTIDEIVNEKVVFMYDPARLWTLDVEYLGNEEGDSVQVLEHVGGVPMQLLDGVKDYNRVMKAASDASDDYHRQALRWAEKVKKFDCDSVNGMLASGKRAAPAYDFNNKSAQAVVLLMDNMIEGKDVALVREMSFRCPECGCACDGRVDPDCPPAQVRGSNRKPVVLMCPGCGKESLLYMRNDGYHTGYSAHNETRCMESLTDLYDAVQDFPADGSEKEKALAQCRIAMAHFRHRSRSDNLADVRKAYDSLDKDEKELRCECLKAIISLDNSLPRDLPSKYLDDALELRDGFDGAVSAVVMSVLARAHPEDVGWYIDRSVSLIESDKTSPLADRIVGCYSLIDLANGFGDKDAIVRAAGWLEPLTGEISALENGTTSEWSAYCLFFEFLVTYLNWFGETGLADKAVKTASAPLVDDWTERIPPAVRNVVGFRRALLFLTNDGDREQALSDLESVRDSLATNEDNGPVTCIRVFMSLILIHWMDPSEKECLTPFVQLFSGIQNGRGWMPPEYVESLFSHFVNAFVTKGMGPGRLQGEIKKLGVDVKVGKGEPFDPAALWRYPLPEFT